VKYDLDFRPRSYWGGTGELLGRISGTARRRFIEKALEEGKLDEVPEALFADQLREPLRRFTGSLDPCLMGGEYLAPLLEGEVEIVRIDLRSTTADAISLRARREAGAIRYRVVDEYPENAECYGEPLYPLWRTESEQPLSFRELLQQIRASSYAGQLEAWGRRGLVVPILRGNLDESMDAEDAVSFVRVSSPHYPQLESWMSERMQRWQRLVEREYERQEEPDRPVEMLAASKPEHVRELSEILADDPSSKS